MDIYDILKATPGALGVVMGVRDAMGIQVIRGSEGAKQARIKLHDREQGPCTHKWNITGIKQHRATEMQESAIITASGWDVAEVADVGYNTKD